MGKYGVSGKRIHNELTNNGQWSIDWCYLFKGELLTWNAPSTCILKSMIDDNDLARACCDYLAARGASFDTKEELLKWAHDHNWENFSVFRDLILNNPQL
jgi:hypothetical protein